jgi:PAS domain S-box-containing protein
MSKESKRSIERLKPADHLHNLLERKRTKEALRESEERYRILTEESPFAVSIISKDGAYQYLNPTFIEMFGYTLDDIPTGREWFRKAYPDKDYRHHVIAAWIGDLKVYKRGESRPRSYKVTCKDGSEKLIHFRPVTMEGGTQFVICDDITERKKAEDEVRKREQELRMITDNIPGLISYVDADGRYRFVNKQYEEWFGIQKREVVGEHYREVLGNAVYQQIQRYVKEALSGKHVQYEEALPYKSGGTRWVHADYVPDFDESGKVKGFFALVGDITGLKLAEEALRKSEAQKKAILDSSIDRIRLSDTDMRIIWANETYKRQLNIAPEDMVGKICYEVFVGRDRPCLECPAQKALESGNTEHAILVRSLSGNEENRYLDSYAVPLKDESGRIVHVLQVTRDITEKVLVEKRLRVSEKRYRNLFNGVPVGLYRTTPNGKVIDANKALVKILGYPNRGTVLQASARESYINEKDRDLFQDIVEKHGAIYGFETQLYRYDGTPVWVAINARVVKNADETILYYEGSLTDITNRKRAEEELERSKEQLRSLADHLQSVREQERTTIAREIHDELGQALTGLKMDLSWMAKRIPEDQPKLLQKLHSMSELTSTTLKTVQRISTELRPGLLDDLGLVAAIEWQTEEFENRTGIRCTLTVDPEDIMIDEKRSTTVFRILQETLTNVARHAQATRVQVSLKEKMGSLTLRVTDNGKGIINEQIFDPKSLGIVGIKERVHSWGGEVKISGRPGKGTTVVVRMPIK